MRTLTNNISPLTNLPTAVGPAQWLFDDQVASIFNISSTSFGAASLDSGVKLTTGPSFGPKCPLLFPSRLNGTAPNFKKLGPVGQNWTDVGTRPPQLSKMGQSTGRQKIVFITVS